MPVVELSIPQNLQTPRKAVEFFDSIHPIKKERLSMKISKIPKEKLSPFGRWLMEYVETHDVSMSAFAVQAGLSSSALRYLIIEPWRKPTLETCLKLAQATGTPLEELLALANLSEAIPEQKSLQPGRWELMSIFDALTADRQKILVDIARALDQSDERANRVPWLAE